jgi:hypothetical protein
VNHVGKDSRWPETCEVLKCEDAEFRPHHHHMFRGKILINICTCSDLEIPGTKPKDSPYEGR